MNEKQDNYMNRGLNRFIFNTTAFTPRLSDFYLLRQNRIPLYLKDEASHPIHSREPKDTCFSSEDLSMENLDQDMITLCKDQNGCRFIQKKLEDENHRESVFIQIYPHFLQLINEPFGNYLCQKMLEYCTSEQRTQLVELITYSMLELSLNAHGTRAVQKMIEVIDSDEQIEKTKKALIPIVIPLVKDINGNHVIQRCLQSFKPKDKQFIFDDLLKHCLQVASQKHGCCVLQRSIDNSAPYQTKQLVDGITQHALSLVQDPFGNYVVQYVLELGDAQFSNQLIGQFVGHLTRLSIQKYSSNVMEKCIRLAEENTRNDLIQEIVDPNILEFLLRDAYANYVVQTSLDYANEKQHKALADYIRPLLYVIRKTSYCKKIEEKLDRKSLGGHPTISFYPLVTSTGPL